MSHISKLLMLFATLSPELKAEAELKVLALSIAEIESGMTYSAVGDRGKAKGAWQMHKAAWQTSNDYRERVQGKQRIKWSQWDDKKNQLEMAVAYLHWLKDRFKENGISNPTPQQYYVAWNWGFSKFKRANFNLHLAPNVSVQNGEYVQNIYTNIFKNEQ